MGINYITVEEAAALLGIKPVSVYMRIRSGTLQAMVVQSNDKRNKWMLDEEYINKIKHTKELYATQAEYAKLHNITRQYVQKLIKTGKLKAVELNGRKMIEI